MSGVALAQSILSKRIEEKRKKEYKTYGGHNEVLPKNDGTLHCFYCKTTVENDGFGIDILKETECFKR